MMRRSAIVLAALSLFCCRDMDKPEERPSAGEAEGGRKAESEPGVKLSRAAQVRAGLRIETLEVQSIEPELRVFGTLQEDPGASFVVRAPLAGTLRAAGPEGWPKLGERFPKDRVFGEIEPRLMPLDSVTLTTQLATARADVDANSASVTAAQAEFERTRLLNADNKNVADKAVEEARARLAAEQARLAAARSNATALGQSLESRGIAPRRLSSDRGGDVVEILAQPGESIEQGAPILRISNFDHLLARVDIPIGERLPAARSASIIPAGFESEPPIRGERIGVAPLTDPQTQSVTLLYRLGRSIYGLRPGASVTVLLPARKTAARGVVIPRSAIVQQNGAFWVYVQAAEDRFIRRRAPIDIPSAKGYIVFTGFASGDRIVVTGAQALLSEEFKSENDAVE